LPYIGGGIGINYSHFYHRASLPENTLLKDEWTSSETFLKWDAVAGLKIPLSSRRHLFFEAKYTIEDVNSFGLFAGIDFLSKTE